MSYAEMAGRYGCCGDCGFAVARPDFDDYCDGCLAEREELVNAAQDARDWWCVPRAPATALSPSRRPVTAASDA